MGFFDRVRTGELMNRLSEVSLCKRPAPCISAAGVHRNAQWPNREAVEVRHAIDIDRSIETCLSPQDTRLMKSAGTTSISVALRSFVVALLGLVSFCTGFGPVRLPLGHA